MSGDAPAFMAGRATALREALGSDIPATEFRQAKTAEEFRKMIATEGHPHLVLVDLPEASAADRTEWGPRFAAVRELDPGVPIFVLTKAMPTGAEVMAWLDAGASGLIKRDFTGKNLSEPLQEMLLKRFRTNLPRHPRAKARHKIEIRIASLEQAVVSETLNVGTGGLFIRAVPQDVSVGDSVDFEFVLSKEVSGGDITGDSKPDPLLAKMDEDLKSASSTLGHRIRGTGHIVWVRTLADRTGPEGIGLQFDELEPEAQKWIKAFVSAHRVRAFVPKS